MSRIEPVEIAFWPRPRGYSNGMVASGRTLYVAGQVGWDEHEKVVSDELVGQFRQALSNIRTVVETAGGRIEDVVRLTIYCCDLDAYRTHHKAIGAAYREVMGKHFPAMALLGVAGLVEPGALVEIEATAVLDDPASENRA
jgi:enamine deaminase RidA (YjgF/YER057c/UK114 family)